MKQLPKSLWKYFWDTNPSTIDAEKYDTYVIERILEWGRKDDLQELKKLYSEDEIETGLKGACQLPKKQAQFFADIWGIPREEVLCLQPEFRRQHRQLWTR